MIPSATKFIFQADARGLVNLCAVARDGRAAGALVLGDEVNVAKYEGHTQVRPSEYNVYREWKAEPSPADLELICTARCTSLGRGIPALRR